MHNSAGDVSFAAQAHNPARHQLVVGTSITLPSTTTTAPEGNPPHQPMADGVG